MVYVRNILNISHKIPDRNIPDYLCVLSLQQVRIFLAYFQDQLSEKGVHPGKPRTRELSRVIFVIRFMDKPGIAIGVA